MESSDLKLNHLLFRAAFGPTPDLMKRFKGKDLAIVIDALLKDSQVVEELNYLSKPNTRDDGKVGPFQALFLVLKSQKQKDELNLAWLDRMAVANAMLREKMTLFWHNHFATGTAFAWLMQVQHNTLRRNALGSFRTMLHEMAKDPAMIIWLNNQQNKKNAPNENFAREVMELFTLGEGNGYTEDDIKNAARAFTGWSIDQTGEYVFNSQQHDYGQKTVFGKTGDFNGEDIINMLLEKRETAVYICRKLYRTFVNIEVDEDHAQELASRFHRSDYDIADLMKALFNSEWFYERKNIGAVIISPTELIVRYKRLCKMVVDDEQMLAMQHALGQKLFSPPNVAGWKGGKTWIDGNSIILRLHIPRAILDAGTARIQRKPAFEAQDEDKKKDGKNDQVKVKSDWSAIVKYFKEVPDNQLTKACLDYLMVCPMDHINAAEVEKLTDHSTKERRIITTICTILQFPESQLI